MHVFITGASAGIGEALAREFGRLGACVTLIARRGERLRGLAGELGCATHVAAVDLADTRAALEAFRGAEAALGPVDVLINNAGVQIVGPTLAADPTRTASLLALNLVTPLALIEACLPRMIERRSGSIVNVSSLAALAIVPGMFHYNASKAGLAAASESLAGELRGTGVHVLTVYPGPVATAMAEEAYGKYDATASWVRWMPTGRADRLARKIRKAVERKRKRIVYPAVYAIARWFLPATRFVMDRFAPRPGKG